MLQSSFRTKAIVLRRTNYGEADRILSMITPDHGKVSAIAKGVRKPKSKLAGGLELLAVCDVTLAEGKGSMALVTSARIDEFYRDILREYERLELAYSFIQHTNRAAETVSEPDFYYLLQNSLEYLNNKNIDWRLTELWFRLHLRGLLGHSLNVATDRSGVKLAADKTYHYDFSEQGFYQDGQGRFGVEHIKLLRLVMSKTPAILRKVSGIEQALEDCLWLARTLEA